MDGRLNTPSGRAPGRHPARRSDAAFAEWCQGTTRSPTRFNNDPMVRHMVTRERLRSPVSLALVFGRAGSKLTSNSGSPSTGIPSTGQTDSSVVVVVSGTVVGG